MHPSASRASASVFLRRFVLCRLGNSDGFKIEYHVNPRFLIFMLNVIFMWERKGINFVLQNNYNLLSGKTLLILRQLILK